MHNSVSGSTPNKEASAIEKSAPKLTGSILERYRIEECIGQGGMGSVYLAEDSIIDRNVAIKVLNHSNASSEQMIRFQQEAIVSGKLNHPSIVKTFDFGFTEADQLFLVMEFVKGKSLEQMIEDNGPLGYRQFTSIFAGILNAMNHAHSNGIVHRDLKPSNILIDLDKPQPSPYILDFGIAKITEGCNFADTKTGVLIGTPSYMSPEQASFSNVDARSDVYSLGCVMYEALCGKPPFHAESTLKLLEKHQLEDAPKLPTDVTAKLPDGLTSIISKMMHKDPNERYQSMLEIDEDLKCLSFEKPIALDIKTDTVLSGNKKQNHLPKILIVSFAAIALVFVAYTLMQTPAENKETVPETAAVNSVSPKAKSIEKIALNMRYNEQMNAKLKKLQLLKSGQTLDNEYVSISYLPELTDEALANLPKHKKLTDLNLSGNRISRNVVSIVSKIPTLQKLRLSEVRLAGAEFEKLKKLSLTDLELNNCALTDVEVSEISKIKSLRVLSLRHNRGITDKGFRSLSALKNLEFLDISATKVSQRGLLGFKGFDKLEIAVQHCNSLLSSDVDKIARKLGVKKIDSDDFRKQALEEYLDSTK